MKTSVIEVHDMLSVLTVDEVEERIGGVPGVESATVNYASGNATVRYDETRLEVADIKVIVHQRGHQPAGEPLPIEESEREPAPTSAAVPTPEAASASASTPVAVVPAPGAPPSPPSPAMAKAGKLDDPSLKNADVVARALGADIENGLTSEEASRRLAQDGPQRTPLRSPAARVASLPVALP